jgi:hypothetical protein
MLMKVPPELRGFVDFAANAFTKYRARRQRIFPANASMQLKLNTDAT